MDLRQVRSYLVVAEELNFHRSARRLSLSQPALTRQIQQLEEFLGCLLLERDKRRVALTPAGRFFQRRGAELVRFADQVTGEVRQEWRRAGETLTLGYTEAVMAAFLPGLLRRFRKHHPGWNIRLTPGHSDFLEQEVRAGRLDAALVSQPGLRPGLTCVEIGHERMGAVLGTDHPLAGRRTIRLRQLATETFLLFPYRDNPRLYSDILAACRSAGFTPPHIEECDSRMVAVNLVTAGYGVALLSEKLAHYCGSGAVFKTLTAPYPVIHFYLIRRGSSSGVVIDGLMEMVGL